VALLLFGGYGGDGWLWRRRNKQQEQTTVGIFNDTPCAAGKAADFFAVPRARPRFMDSAKFCVAPPVKSHSTTTEVTRHATTSRREETIRNNQPVRREDERAG
jgi:hypothetical protein